MDIERAVGVDSLDLLDYLHPAFRGLDFGLVAGKYSR